MWTWPNWNRRGSGTVARGTAVVIKWLGDMPDGPRRARLSADPRAELINNRDTFPPTSRSVCLSFCPPGAHGGAGRSPTRDLFVESGAEASDVIGKCGNWVASDSDELLVTRRKNPLYPSWKIDLLRDERNFSATSWRAPAISHFLSLSLSLLRLLSQYTHRVTIMRG